MSTTTEAFLRPFVLGWRPDRSLDPYLVSAIYRFGSSRMPQSFYLYRDRLREVEPGRTWDHRGALVPQPAPSRDRYLNPSYQGHDLITLVLNTGKLGGSGHGSWVQPEVLPDWEGPAENRQSKLAEVRSYQTQSGRTSQKGSGVDAKFIECFSTLEPLCDLLRAREELSTKSKAPKSKATAMPAAAAAPLPVVSTPLAPSPSLNLRSSDLSYP
ncbi:hypothetical protein B0H14DRAFT_2643566 [Mycena olivaceomarginata]|nr:hypothetical protein B0H14DRAFT_2643566 [Mycena olivaceomarginata]